MAPSLSQRLARGVKTALKDPGQVPQKARNFAKKELGIPLARRYLAGRAFNPLVLSCNLTFRCNLHCEQCLQGRLRDESQLLYFERPSGEMDLALWLKVLDEAAGMKLVLYITGGEPMLYKDFDGFMLGAHGRGLPCHLQTNGTLLAKKAEFLIDLDLDSCTVSLDGLEETHDRVRGLKGAFGLAQKGVKALLKARGSKSRPFVELNCCILKDNLNELPGLVEVAADWGVDLLRFQHVMFNTPDKVASHNRIWDESFAQRHGFNVILPSIPEHEVYACGMDQAEVKGELAKALDRVRRRAEGLVPVEFSPNLEPEQLLPYYLDMDHPFPHGCKAPWRGMRIVPDGTVLGCFHLVLGDVKKQSLAEIWQGPAFVEFRRLISKGLYPGCARCCSRFGA